jgi:hypothetical protein
MSDKLVLNEFKNAYKAVEGSLPKPLAFLVYGLLIWIQEWYLNRKVTTAVDRAIEEYEQHPVAAVVLAPVVPKLSPAKAVDKAIEEYKLQEETPPALIDGVFSSTGDDFFDEIRIQARFTLTPNNINDDGTNL